MGRNRWAGAVVLLSVASLIGCGGGEDGDGPAPPAATTTAVGVTSTDGSTPEAPTTTRPSADGDTEALAAASVFEASDLPEAWTVAADAQPYSTEGIAIDECLNPADGLLAQLPHNATAAGPTFRAPDDLYFFVTTWSAVFDDAETAQEWADTRNSPDLHACEAQMRRGAGGSEFRVMDDPDVGWDGPGQTAAASYGMEILDDGEVTAHTYSFVYVTGRVALTVAMEMGGMEEADAQPLLQAEAAARGAALSRAAG